MSVTLDIDFRNFVLDGGLNLRNNVKIKHYVKWLQDIPQALTILMSCCKKLKQRSTITLWLLSLKRVSETLFRYFFTLSRRLALLNSSSKSSEINRPPKTASAALKAKICQTLPSVNGEKRETDHNRV